jgi:hypothetical protein
MTAMTEAGAPSSSEAAAPEPVSGRSNSLGWAGKTKRLERGVRVPCTALHASVAMPRHVCVRRWADRLSCSLVEMSERRAGRHTGGQTHCRSYREESLPHRRAPSVNDTDIHPYTASGAFRHTTARLPGATHVPGMIERKFAEWRGGAPAPS